MTNDDLKLKPCPFCGGKATPLIQWTVWEREKTRFDDEERRITKRRRWSKSREEDLNKKQEENIDCFLYTIQKKIIDKTYFVECSQCCANTIGGSMKEAADSWNDRV